MANPLLILTAAFAVLTLGFLWLTERALKKKRVMRTATSTLLALLMLSLAALFGTLSVSTQGYRALTHEELAASVTTRIGTRASASSCSSTLSRRSARPRQTFSTDPRLDFPKMSQ